MITGVLDCPSAAVSTQRSGSSSPGEIRNGDEIATTSNGAVIPFVYADTTAGIYGSEDDGDGDSGGRETGDALVRLEDWVQGRESRHSGPWLRAWTY